MAAAFRSRARFVALVIGLWLLLGAFLGAQSHLNTALAGEPIPLRVTLRIACERYLIYAALTFPLLWLCRRFPFTARRWPRWVAVQTLGLTLFTLLYAGLRILTGSTYDGEGLRRLPPTLHTAADLIREGFFEQFWMYSSMVAAILAFEYYRQYRRRELRESDLRRRVAEYELQVLRLQLHPHFLFNTINGIATLMLREVGTAREMLLRLSDLLRIALSHAADNEASLREEIEFVKAYLDLERMRFGARLAVRLSIDPDCLDLRVPYMILQPLLENAIRHGIAEIRAGGTLALAAACRDGRLQIRIINDGPKSVPPGRTERGSGIGLNNARARLDRSYGDAYRLALVDRPQGGAELHMELPLRSLASLAEAPA